MKKNRMMRIASCLLVLVLLTTCVISGTFAKYVTSDDAKDVAQVAKWGVTVTANLTDLFEVGYTANDEATTTDTAASVLTSVQNVNMLAPGTKDSQTNALVITGTPEVRVRVTYTCDVELTKWVIVEDDPQTLDANETVEYCPLKITITVDGTDTVFTIGAQETVNDFEARIEEHITDLSKASVDPNKNLAQTISIAWEWAYYVDADTDAKDTTLGNNAADPNKGPATFSFAIGATVTQLD